MEGPTNAQSPQVPAIRWGCLAGLTAAVGLYAASRLLGAPWSNYRLLALPAGLLTGGATYWIQRPTGTAKKTDDQSPTATGTDPIQPIDPVPAPSPLQPDLDLPDTVVTVDLFKACDALQEALDRNASPTEIRARLMEAYAYSTATDRPTNCDKHDALLNLLYSKDHYRFRLAFCQSAPLQPLLNGSGETFGEALGEWKPCPLAVANRGLAGVFLVRESTTVAHTGILTLEDDTQLQQILQVTERSQFQARGLRIENATNLPAILDLVEKKFPQIQHIEVRGIEELEIDASSPLLNKLSLPDLKRLSVKGDPSQILSLLHGLPKLETLTLENGDDLLFLPHLINLRTLHVGTTPSFSWIAQSCPLLETLTVENQDKNERLAIARRKTTHLSPLCTQLKSYSPEQCSSVFWSYPKLETPLAGSGLVTTLSIATKSTAELKRALTLFSNLQSLTLSNAEISTDVIYEIAKYPKITRVEFPNGAIRGTNRGPLGPHLLAQVAHLPPFKENLHTFYKGPFFAHALFQIPAAKAGLKVNLFHDDHTTLDPLSSALWLADGNYNHLVGVTNKIDTLLIEDMADLTDDQLVAFVRCFKPKRLSIQRCPQITSEAIQKILGHCLPNGLNSLNLTGCRGLDDLAFVDAQTNTDFNMSTLEELVAHDTPISDSYKRVVLGRRALTGNDRVNLLMGRVNQIHSDQNFSSYRALVEWYNDNRQNMGSKIPKETSLAAGTAYLEFFYTDHFPKDTSIETLIEIHAYATENQRNLVAAKRIEAILCGKVGGNNFTQLLMFAAEKQLPTLLGALLSYATISGIPYEGERFDPEDDSLADLTITPYMAGQQGIDVPFGDPQKVNRALIRGCSEIERLLHPGYDLYLDSDFQWSDKAMELEGGPLAYFVDLLARKRRLSDLPLSNNNCLFVTTGLYGLAKRAGAEHLQKQIKEWTERWVRENSQAAMDDPYLTPVQMVLNNM